MPFSLRIISMSSRIWMNYPLVESDSTLVNFRRGAVSSFDVEHCVRKWASSFIQLSWSIVHGLSFFVLKSSNRHKKQGCGTDLRDIEKLASFYTKCPRMVLPFRKSPNWIIPPIIDFSF